MLLAAATHLRPLRRLEKHRAIHAARPGRLRLGHRTHATGAALPLQYVLIGLLVGRRHRGGPADLATPTPVGVSQRIAVPPEDEADTPADLARAVDSGRVALREVDDARAAIIACYVAMEDSLAEAGAARAAAETPDELLGRAGAAGLVDAAPAGRLTACSTRPGSRRIRCRTARRNEAERALAELAASLTAPDKTRGRGRHRRDPARASDDARASRQRGAPWPRAPAPAPARRWRDATREITVAFLLVVAITVATWVLAGQAAAGFAALACAALSLVALRALVQPHEPPAIPLLSPELGPSRSFLGFWRTRSDLIDATRSLSAWDNGLRPQADEPARGQALRAARDQPGRGPRGRQAGAHRGRPGQDGP